MRHAIVKQAFGSLSDVLIAAVDDLRPGTSDVARALSDSVGRYRDMIVFDAREWDDARYRREVMHHDPVAYRMYQATKVIPERLTGGRSDPVTMASLAAAVFAELLDRLPEFGVDQLVLFLQRTSDAGEPHTWAMRFIVSDDAFDEADILWTDGCDGIALRGNVSSAPTIVPGGALA